MRKYQPKKDLTKQNYYEDRFFVSKETEKLPVLGTKFECDIINLQEFYIENSYVEFDTLIIFINKNDNIKILEKLKSIGYEILCDISGIDFIANRGGIEVFYQLLDIKHTKRARVKCFVENKTFLKSATSVFKSANWAERELYDMFGVWIQNHPNLSRILMPDDWYGHPLLKSYPLEGDEHAKWYEVDKIFGKEYRDEIGEENRNPAFIDEKDTFNFAKIYHETEYGKERPSQPVIQEYQEDCGIKLVKRIKKDNFKLLKKRR